MTPELWHLTLQRRLVLCWSKGLTVNIWWRRPGNLTTSTVCILVRVTTSKKNCTCSGKTKFRDCIGESWRDCLYLSSSTSSQRLFVFIIFNILSNNNILSQSKNYFRFFFPLLFPSQHSVVTGFQTMKETGRWNRKTQMFQVTGRKTPTYLLTYSPLLV